MAQAFQIDDRFANHEVGQLWRAVDELDRRAFGDVTNLTKITDTLTNTIIYPPFVEPVGGPGSGDQSADKTLLVDYWIRSDTPSINFIDWDTWFYYELVPSLGGGKYQWNRWWVVGYGGWKVLNFQGTDYVPQCGILNFPTGSDPSVFGPGAGPVNMAGDSLLSPGAASEEVDDVWDVRYPLDIVINTTGEHDPFTPSLLLHDQYLAQEDSLALAVQNLWSTTKLVDNFPNVLPGDYGASMLHVACEYVLASDM